MKVTKKENHVCCTLQERVAHTATSAICNIQSGMRSFQKISEDAMLVVQGTIHHAIAQGLVEGATGKMMTTLSGVVPYSYQRGQEEKRLLYQGKTNKDQPHHKA